MTDFIVIIVLIIVLCLIYRATKPSQGEGCAGCGKDCSRCGSDLYEEYRRDHPLQ